MKPTTLPVALSLVGMLIAAAVLATQGTRAAAQAGNAGGHESLLMSKTLDNIPGSNLTAVVVDYPAGGKSPAHHHAGSVFAYVIAGAIRSQNSATGPVRVYRAGESFFEPAGSVHRVSENASSTAPAKLLAVFVAPLGVQLTAPEK